VRNPGSPGQQDSQVTALHHRLRPNRVLSQARLPTSRSNPYLTLTEFTLMPRSEYVTLGMRHSLTVTTRRFACF
jgi:hypothetical protein